MGINPDEIKNPHLRKQLLELKAAVNKKTIKPAPAVQPAVESSTITTEKSTELFFNVPGIPMGKPRMTQRDKWQRRPCVIRYREYCDKIRACAGTIPNDPLAVHIKAYLPMSASWSNKKKSELLGKRQRQKPDWDNIGKAICDALFEEDSCIAVGITEKFWCEEGKQRTEVKVIYEESVLTRYGIGIDKK
jgi:Holliday junction resolvase RusA-like endonuclease